MKKISKDLKFTIDVMTSEYRRNLIRLIKKYDIKEVKLTGKAP